MGDQRDVVSNSMTHIMTLNAVAELVHAFEKEDIYYVVFSGFAFDALKGKISRPHKDVDMLVLHDDFKKIKRVVKSLGYKGTSKEGLFTIKRDDGSKADLERVTHEKKNIVITGSNKLTKIPSELFEASQRVELEGLSLNIASNEILKLWGLYDRKGFDLEYAKALPVNTSLFEKIKRVQRTTYSLP